MEKSVHSIGYKLFLRLLREARTDADLSQEALGERLGEPQSFISKCERGERRLDVVDLQRFCSAMGVPLAQFCGKFERALEKGGR